MDRSRSQQHGELFQEAIARHQLDLHTELKRSTSLPSSMFDASDPMLEARLCAATEDIFRCLLEHDVPAQPEVAGIQRLEPVEAGELGALLRAAMAGEFADDAPPALDEFADVEFPALLAETCARSHGHSQHRAAELLLAGDSASTDLDGLTRDLAALLQSTPAADTGRWGADIDAVCRRIAAAAIRCTARLEDPRA